MRPPPSNPHTTGAVSAPGPVKAARIVVGGGLLGGLLQVLYSGAVLVLLLLPVSRAYYIGGS